MATQTVEFHAEQGLALTASLYAVGSDTAVASVAAAAAANRKVVYAAAFTNVAAGTYELIATDGTEVVCSWYVQLAAATGTYRAGDAAWLALQILRNKTITDPAAGTITVYSDDGAAALFAAALYEDAAGVQPYRGKGAELRHRLA